MKKKSTLNLGVIASTIITTIIPFPGTSADINIPISQQNTPITPYHREIQDWAKKITVLIERYDNYEQESIFAGSGVILRGSYPNQYYVVTTKHALKLEDRYRVRFSN